MFTGLGPDRQWGHSGAGVPPSSGIVSRSLRPAPPGAQLCRDPFPAQHALRPKPGVAHLPTPQKNSGRCERAAGPPGLVPKEGEEEGEDEGSDAPDRDEDQGGRSAGTAWEASAWSVPSDPLVASAPRRWPRDTPHYSPAPAARLLPFLRLTSPPASGGWVCPVSRGLVRGLPQSWVPAAWPVLLVTVEQDADPGS